MRVIDAGVLVGLLVGDLSPDVLGDEELAIPHLLDSEVTSVLRKLVLRRQLTEDQGDAAFNGFLDLALTRFPAEPLRSRMWALRHNLTGYDATYVALAETVDASTLLTTDAKLAAASGVECRITLV
jgi:predicted nucleic acid-binding protein